MTETTQGERDSAAYKIFHQAFEVSIPQYATVNKVDAALYGSIKMRDKQHEMELAKSNVRTLRTISALSVLHSQGIPVILINHDRDSITIYSIITRHLKDMADHINSEMAFMLEGSDQEERIRRLVVDLEILEEFARAVYPMAVRSLPIHNRNISLRSKLNRFSMMAKSGPQTEVTPVLTAGAPTTMNELLSSTAIKRTKTWE